MKSISSSEMTGSSRGVAEGTSPEAISLHKIVSCLAGGFAAAALIAAPVIVFGPDSLSLKSNLPLDSGQQSQWISLGKKMQGATDAGEVQKTMREMDLLLSRVSRSECNGSRPENATEWDLDASGKPNPKNTISFLCDTRTWTVDGDLLNGKNGDVSFTTRLVPWVPVGHRHVYPQLGGTSTLVRRE